jgi:hypothetical protein
MTSLENFTKELQEDTQIDELNLLQKQLQLPAIKHKWVARLIFEKQKLNRLNSKKKQLKEAVLCSFEQNGMPPGIPKSKIERKIEASTEIIKIDEEIQDSEIIIEYLEKVETIFRSMTYDLKNIVDITRMETT